MTISSDRDFELELLRGRAGHQPTPPQNWPARVAPPSPKPVAPRPLFREVSEPEPFPIESLGELLAPAARAIHDIIQAPIAVGAQSVLATATLAAQGCANVRLPYGPSRPLSDYFLLILESGERKTAADDIAARPLHEHERELVARYKTDLDDHNAAAAAFEAEWKRVSNDKKLSQHERKERLAALGAKPQAPAYPMLVCGEPTYEGLFRLLQQGQPSAGIFSSEGGQLIGGYAMSDEHRLRTAAGLSEGWDGKPWKRVRGGDGLTVLPNRRLTLNLMVQPLVASRLLSDSVLRDQGVLSRVLVAAPRGTSGTRLSHEPDAASDTALDKYTLYVLEILRSGQAGRDDELPPLGFSGRARELWIAFADSIERQLGPEGKLAPVQPFANKAAEHAARIAGVLTVVANIKASDINHDTLTAAIDIVQFYLGEALRLHDIAQVDETLQRAQRLLDWLGRRWPERLLSLVDIYQRGPTEFRDRASAHAAVKILEEHGWLIHLDGVHEVAGTPRRDVWRIVAAG